MTAEDGKMDKAFTIREVKPEDAGRLAEIYSYY